MAELIGHLPKDPKVGSSNLGGADGFVKIDM
jgi:hypothetical protein